MDESTTINTPPEDGSSSTHGIGPMVGTALAAPTIPHGSPNHDGVTSLACVHDGAFNLEASTCW